jgi:hypothetical protein
VLELGPSAAWATGSVCGIQPLKDDAFPVLTTEPIQEVTRLGRCKCGLSHHDRTLHGLTQQIEQVHIPQLI